MSIAWDPFVEQHDGMGVDFRGYLKAIPDDLLEAVAGDYLWLAASFEGDPAGIEFVARREACRDECACRGLLPELRPAA